jgi:hypothetical protein
MHKVPRPGNIRGQYSSGVSVKENGQLQNASMLSLLAELSSLAWQP